MSRRPLAVFVSAALVLTGLTVTGVVTTPAATASESSMLSQVNAARANNGLSAYRWNAHLADVAEEQARRMARQTRLFHNPDLAGDVGNYRRVGENVGYGPTSSAVQKAFMKSPAHRANILRNYTQIGIAEVRDSTGRLWVAQVFRDPAGSASNARTQLKTVTKAKKSVTAKKAAPVKKASAVQRPAAVKKRTAGASVPATRPAPIATWAAVSCVIGLANFVATANGGLVAPVFQDE